MQTEQQVRVVAGVNGGHGRKPRVDPNPPLPLVFAALAYLEARERLNRACRLRDKAELAGRDLAPIRKLVSERFDTLIFASGTLNSRFREFGRGSAVIVGAWLLYLDNGRIDGENTRAPEIHLGRLDGSKVCGLCHGRGRDLSPITREDRRCDLCGGTGSKAWNHAPANLDAILGALADDHISEIIELWELAQ